MKKFLFVIVIGISTLTGFAQRKIINIDNNWKFGTTTDSSVTGSKFNDSGWVQINLPHTWNNFDGQVGDKEYNRSAHWYRKQIFIDKDSKNKKIFLRFGAANSKTDVYINSKYAGTHYGGYAAFIFDITDFIEQGSINTIAIRVDNSSKIDIAPLTADFTFFGGITRSLEMIVTEKLFISPLDYASSGVYITPYDISGNSAKVRSEIIVGNHTNKKKNIQIYTIIKDNANCIVDSSITDINIASDTIISINQQLLIQKPILWDGQKDPYMYKAIVRIVSEGFLKDEIQQNFGLRTFNVSVDSGFYLNNRHYPLHGVAMHEDRRNKGRAISDKDRKEDLDLMYTMGCNYLRLAHYQHSALTYNYCDSTGIVIWTEVPAVNKISNSQLFQENIKNQLRELIKQNYNHPSICFWGLCNEIDYQGGPNPASLIKELNKIAKELDSTRFTVAAAMFDERASNWIPDLISWNKYFGWYYGEYTDFAAWADTMKEKHPDSKIGVSEYGVGANPFQHQENPTKPVHNSNFHPEEYQNLFHESYWQEMQKRINLWSTSVWVGFDFSSAGRDEGNNPGVNDKGLVTQDRSITKDAYYFYKANWTMDPFVYITSRRFVNRTDSITEVKAYSNCEKVYLKVNNKSYSYVKSDNHIYRWENIQLEPGLNNILIQGEKDGNKYSDTCTWNYKPVSDTQ
jgi:beta-galactosidase